MTTTTKKNSGRKTSAKKKSPVTVAAILQKNAAKSRAKETRVKQTASPLEQTASAPSGDAYAFVSQRYRSFARSWESFRGEFKKHPIRALQDVQFRTLALISKAIPRGEKKEEGKPDYVSLRREWLKRRLFQGKPLRTFKSKLPKK